MHSVLLLIAFSVVGLAQGQKNYNVSGIPENLKINASSVVRSEKVTISIPEQDQLIVSVHRSVTVLDKNGNNHVDAFVEYDKSRKVKKLLAVVYDAEGKEIIKFKKKDFNDLSAVAGGTLYSDNRIMYLTYYPKNYPYTIVIDYVIESKNTAFLPTWYQYSNYNSSIESKTLTIVHEPSLGLRHKVFDPDGVLQIKEDQESFSVTATNLESLLAEPYGPAKFKTVPNITFAANKFHLEGLDGTARSWEEFGKWEYDNLIDGLDQLPTETITKISKLVANAEDDKEKVRLIYRFVQDNTRYISVQLGIGGLRPYPANEVDKLGYGDCKGLSNYTMALLKSQGIESFYAEVWGGDAKRDIEKDFASIQGNHVILNVPLEDEEIWLECTSQTLPFNFLGNFTDDRDVLLLTPDGGVIKRTPKYAGNDNKIITKANYSINPGGTLTAEIEMKSTGIQYDRRFAVARLDSQDQETFYQRYWRYIDNISLESVEFSNNQKDVLFKEKIVLQAKAYANKAGNKLFVPLNAFHRITSKPAVNNDRKQRIVFDREFVYKDSYFINIPDTYAIESIPKPIEIVSPFGTYRTTVENISDNKVSFRRSLRLNEGTFEADSYNEFRSFMRKVNTADNQKMIIVKILN